MLNIGRMAPGSHDYYLTVVTDGADDYYLRRGEAPGRWLWRGLDQVDLTGLVFTWEDGRAIHPHNPTRWLRELSAELGLPNLGGPHGLRHSYATIALTSGVPVKVVSERLGHTTSITLDTYAHVLNRDDAEAAEQAAAAILGGGS